MFRKILVLLKDGFKETEIVESIKNILSKSEIKIISFNDLKKKDILNVDLVITIGGDGTFVKAAHLVEDSFILGINSSPDTSEGALTSVNINEINELKKLDKKDFRIIERPRAEVILNNKILEEKAVNEVYIGASSQFHSSRYKIKFKDKEEEQRSSGIIVSTGTGSSAWFLSAGGQPFNYEEKRLCFLVREPYFGKRVYKPTILKGEVLEDQEIVITSTRDFGGIIAINDSTYDFNSGDIVKIKLSNKPLKVIELE
jgi:NAD+ kinase